MNTKLKSIAIFCGSNFGTRPIYKEAAITLGQLLAREEITLIYGGTQTGLMGVVADAALDAGGKVIGVIYQGLHARGQSHPGLSSLEITEDRRQRRARMIELSDAFIALPGGLGTLEELFEVATLTQIGDHSKPCGVLNIDGFYDPLADQLYRAVAEEFMKPEHRDMILIRPTAQSLIEGLSTWQPPVITKWINQPKA